MASKYAVAVCALIVLSAGRAAAQGDVAAGHATAKRWCARCHVIGAENSKGGINSTPSFFIMARKPERYGSKILTFQDRRPHAALTFDVSKQDVRNVRAYILSLPRD